MRVLRKILHKYRISKNFDHLIFICNNFKYFKLKRIRKSSLSLDEHRHIIKFNEKLTKKRMKIIYSS